MKDEKPVVDAGRRCLDLTVVVRSLPKTGNRVTFEASDKERAALAAFLEILSVDALTADLTVAPWRRDGVSVKGAMSAIVRQVSVVTLEPVEERIDQDLDLVFLPEHSRLARIDSGDDGEIHLDPDGDDIPETFSGDRIDLGAALEEQLALALEPYPREDGAAFEAFDTDPEPDARAPSPFAGLKGLKAAKSEEKG
ncbi:DUF177 domain-containing protein [Aureimonas altamirensis]|uniref:YceD family protein n=1 Tax=Aureimonas altamirensis TaxID=370622 RepID=UPI0020376261|nr:DUF177 domain-containing protein [Aureimonas altamirensis]MCM2505805.1 DUF177 domain-containing protein [Aureimonas altamirensis]